MNCPVYIGIPMRCVNAAEPRFGLARSRRSRSASTGDRAQRMILRCAVLGCPRVEVVPGSLPQQEHGVLVPVEELDAIV